MDKLVRINNAVNFYNKYLPVRYARRTKSELTVTEIIAIYFIRDRRGVKFMKSPKPSYLPKNKILSKKKSQGLMGKSKKQNVIIEAQEYIEYLEQNPHTTYSDIATNFRTNKVRVCRLIQLFQNLPPEIKNFISEQNNPDFNWHFTERKLRELRSLKTEKITRFKEMIGNFNQENNVSLTFSGVQ